MKTAEQDKITKRIESVRKRLISLGFLCLSSGKFGLPSYSHVQAWSKGNILLYLVYDDGNGGWDILRSIDNSNEVSKTWEIVESLVKGVDNGENG